MMMDNRTIADLSEKDIRQIIDDFADCCYTLTQFHFDGVLLLGNTLNNAGENMILREKILKAKVPAICLEYVLT